MIKLLLVNPPLDGAFPGLPLGLASLAAYLREAKIDVHVLDAWAEHLNSETIGRMVEEIKPDLVGITVSTINLESAIVTSRAIKKHLEIPIVIGGPHASALPEQCLRDSPSIDFVVVGEGEISLLDLARAVGSPGTNLETINGLVHRRGDEIIRNSPRIPIANLDSLPLPARDLFPLERYRTHLPYGRRSPYFTLITSRGCPFECIYCSNDVFGRSFRAFSPKRVIE